MTTDVNPAKQAIHDKLEAQIKTAEAKFYKGGSQEKTLLLRPEFFLLPSPRERARVLTSRTTVSVCRAQ
jgi:hypothetical protein